MLLFLGHLRELELNGFGKFYQKGEYDENGKKVFQKIFFKPSPDNLTPDDPNLKRGGVTLALYRARYHDTSEMKPKEIKLCLQSHPHREIINQLLSQESSSGESFIPDSLEMDESQSSTSSSQASQMSQGSQMSQTSQVSNDDEFPQLSSYQLD